MNETLEMLESITPSFLAVEFLVAFLVGALYEAIFRLGRFIINEGAGTQGEGNKESKVIALCFTGGIIACGFVHPYLMIGALFFLGLALVNGAMIAFFVNIQRIESGARR